MVVIIYFFACCSGFCFLFVVLLLEKNSRKNNSLNSPFTIFFGGGKTFLAACELLEHGSCLLSGAPHADRAFGPHVAHSLAPGPQRLDLRLGRNGQQRRFMPGQPARP